MRRGGRNKPHRILHPGPLTGLDVKEIKSKTTHRHMLQRPDCIIWCLCSEVLQVCNTEHVLLSNLCYSIPLTSTVALQVSHFSQRATLTPQEVDKHHVHKQSINQTQSSWLNLWTTCLSSVRWKPCRRLVSGPWVSSVRTEPSHFNRVTCWQCEIKHRNLLKIKLV